MVLRFFCVLVEVFRIFLRIGGGEQFRYRLFTYFFHHGHLPEFHYLRTNEITVLRKRQILGYFHQSFNRANCVEDFLPSVDHLSRTRPVSSVEASRGWK